jgi:hypothetical protein
LTRNKQIGYYNNQPKNQTLTNPNDIVSNIHCDNDWLVEEIGGDVEEKPVIKPIKCPEIEIKLNQLELKALIDTGCNANYLQGQRYEQNQQIIGTHETFTITNLNITTATGLKSKRTRKTITKHNKINNYNDEQCPIQNTNQLKTQDTDNEPINNHIDFNYLNKAIPYKNKIKYEQPDKENKTYQDIAQEDEVVINHKIITHNIRENKSTENDEIRESKRTKNPDSNYMKNEQLDRLFLDGETTFPYDPGGICIKDSQMTMIALVRVKNINFFDSNVMLRDVNQTI